ncbi:hypothetical protein [Akkermansia muciniphila]|uniref:hypothetical protein n=2 Tax=Akkermansia TaxID=239934 RepID=UPI0011784C8D|nr:hypothetical protein [Akkermansia muciniphila]
MSANGSQEKLALLMRVASSRLDIVNEADSLVQKTQQQADHFRKLKKKAMSLPVIGSIVGTVGGVLLIRMFTGKKRRNPVPSPQPPASGSWVHSSIFRFIVEILITLAFPSLKKMGLGLAGKKFLSLFK